ncbi:hypothetical protein Daura_04155 [Dactylosporangium aurantiacum]|uniref:DUF7144 domain-containing protein n=1 Tax=Dactylosporangium aurantiacum TaxID=35754 RepID=A0A9Q9IG57_9ACTN|nr:hypothetical protein [Dactylosporangium aurantiacum]MDG6109432.1 hypothetical protein [Dactylosporangium aurantiacum]UWZ55442.1 hypothetical protein Daura_04155 [Dactylosporangium aurantiacum]
MTKSRTVWFGWVTFAAVMLVVLGLLNVLEGLVALLQNQVAFIDGDSLVVVNLTGWGILMLAFGGLLLAAGIGLLARNTVARVAAIVIVALHALIQVGTLGAYPVWSLLMISLSVVVLFALTVHWDDSLEPAATPMTTGTHRADREQPREFQPAADYRGYGSGIPMNSPTSPSHTGARAADAPSYGTGPTSGTGAGANVGPYPPGGPYTAGRPGATSRPNEGAHAAEQPSGRHGDVSASGEAPQPPRYGDTDRWADPHRRGAHAAPTSDHGII